MFINSILNRSIILFYFNRILGYSITLVSFTFKLPQIYTLYKTKSTESLSVASNYFDFYSVLFQGLYSIHKNLSIVIYLEYFSTSIQNAVIIILSWKYSKKKENNWKDVLWKCIFIISTVVIICLFLWEKGKYINENIWSAVVYCGLPFMSISRLTQMKIIYVKKSVGSVSFASFVMRAAKNFLKVIVIIIEEVNVPLIINQAYYGILTLGVIVMYLKYKNRDNYNKEESIKTMDEAITIEIRKEAEELKLLKSKNN